MRMAKPELLRQVVERHNLPFATTTMAKGMIDEDHPLSIGCIERSCRQIQRKLLRSADLIVGLGYDTIEVEYEAWIGDVPLLQIDIETVDVAPSVKVAHEVTGDLDASLTRLAAPARQHATPGRPTRSPSTAARSRRRCGPRPTRFTAHAAIDAVRRALPREGLLSFDVGAHTHQIASQWTAHAPKTFHITNGWSSMGFGLPGAIAAKLARPDLPVVCLIGDGCFQMTCGEVAVAKRMGLTLPVVVLDDKWLALIKVKQIRRQFPLYGTELQAEDYTEPPRTISACRRSACAAPQALEDAVKTALGRQGPDRDRGGGRFRPLRRHGLRLTGLRAGLDAAFAASWRSNRRKGTDPWHKLRHIAIIVEDPEASAKFFEEAFDMKRAGTARRGIYMSDGVFNVALLKKETDKERLGLYHFGMWVDDLDEAEKKVVAGRRRISRRPADLAEVVLRGQVQDPRPASCSTSPTPAGPAR